MNAITRSGNFLRNENGTLVNLEGYPVTSPDGTEITLEEGRITFDHTGNVFVNDSQIGQIGIFSFDNDEETISVGNGLYTTTAQKI